MPRVHRYHSSPHGRYLQSATLVVSEGKTVGLSLHHVFRIVRQWWWLLLLLPALAGAAAYRYGSNQPDQYASTSTVLVSTEPTSGIDFGTIQGNRELAVTYQQLVTSWPVLEPVITDLGLSIALE